jgi:hypothetical protein
MECLTIAFARKIRSSIRQASSQVQETLQSKIVIDYLFSVSTERQNTIASLQQAS